MAKQIHILHLKPTQMALGMEEVRVCAKKLSKLKPKHLKREIKKHTVSVIIGPAGDHFIVDGHHHACALWMMGEKKIGFKVRKDLSKSGLSVDGFWRKMKKNNWTHLYDQFGKGPQDPLYLPVDIRGLGDDPYRSLAWMVEKQGGYKKTEHPFATFAWAGFFRRRKLLHYQFKRDFEPALKAALQAARAPSARHLPGFIK